MQILTENPMLMISVIVFIACVIIGFFGDRYLRSKNKIEKILDVQKKDEVKLDVNSTDLSNNHELKETNPELITSENVNNFYSAQDTITSSATATNVNLGIDNQMSNQVINSGMNEQNINSIDNSNQLANVSNNLEQGVSQPIIPESYPSENNPQNVIGMPTPFDGQINTDDNINNIF